MKRMLINATHTDEIRVAIADGQKLYDLDIDSAGHYRKKGNIYKARITRVEPSLEACFVNYGSERHGFLPYKEISPAYCKQAPKGQPRLPINKALKEGDEIIVQVNKEERGNKGAALSTYISLAGRYLVYMPGNHRAGGISRQIKGDKRAHLQDVMRRLDIPNNDGVIVRTAGIGCAFEELEWDFTYLKQVWEAIQTAADNKNAPFFIYQESDLFIRALRDYLQPDIGEILIDDRESYEKAREFMQQVMPHNLKKLSHYDDTTPLFSRYQIERQIQSAFEREVKLPSGGSIVIDHTEALLSIDINSARATKGADVEATATHTNLEAADEIARQLRIRDLGGLVVIDFIDMRNHKNQREVENRMRAAADIDRARVQVGKISKFGLLEMSRQRLRSSINDSSQVTCPTCSGHGFIRSMDSLVISVIRLTEEEMIKPKTGKVVIQAPIEITNKILNEKRTELNEMEKRHKVQVAVISNENLSFPDFHVQRYNINEANINVADIKLVTPEDCHKAAQKLDPPAPTKEKAMLQMVKPDAQAPKRSLGFKITSWFKSLFSNSDSTTKNKKHQSNKYNGQKRQKNHNKNANKNLNKNQNSTKTQNNKHNSNKKQQHNQQQNKQQTAKKPQHNKQQKQQPNKAQQPVRNKIDSKNSNQKNSDQNNNEQNKGNKKPRTKSIYGNKNRGSKYNKTPESQNKTDNQNNTAAEQSDAQVVKKMTRPLGSVAELAAKKSAANNKQEKTPNAQQQSKTNNLEKSNNKPGLHKMSSAKTPKQADNIDSKTADKKIKQDNDKPKKKAVETQPKVNTQSKSDNKSPIKTNPINKSDKTTVKNSRTKAQGKPDTESAKKPPVKSNLPKAVSQPTVKAIATGKPGIHKLTKTTDKPSAKTTTVAAPKTTESSEIKPATQTITKKATKKVAKKTTKKKTTKKKVAKKTTKKTAKKKVAVKKEIVKKISKKQVQPKEKMPENKQPDMFKETKDEPTET